MRQAKQVLERQTELNGSIRKLRASPAFAASSGKPTHALVQPHRQRAAGLESCVVLFPVCGAVAGLTGVAHAASLPLAEQRFMQQRR